MIYKALQARFEHGKGKIPLKAVLFNAPSTIDSEVDCPDDAKGWARNRRVSATHSAGEPRGRGRSTKVTGLRPYPCSKSKGALIYHIVCGMYGLEDGVLYLTTQKENSGE